MENANKPTKHLFIATLVPTGKKQKKGQDRDTINRRMLRVPPKKTSWHEKAVSE
jgi:hypothetical protein